jgi:glyoxylase-like metal-dependent hydrolase (beta-lactamase superfamily II)
MNIKHFFDPNTSTFTYVISCPSTNQCAIIDSVLDFDIQSGRTSTLSADEIIEYITSMKLKVEWILETHAHADHLSGAQYLKRKLGGKVSIGEHIKSVLDFWVPVFNTSEDTPLDGSQFDILFKDGDVFKIGKIDVKVMHTPGHTPACISYLIGEHVFVGDTLLMPHIGTARADFPGGSAQTLYESIQKLLALPEQTKIYTCHDYPAPGSEAGYLTTVQEQQLNNKMIHQGTTKEDYIQTRSEKDKGMPVPKLLLPSIQVNIRAGFLGDEEDNGVQYIKIPLNKL